MKTTEKFLKITKSGGMQRFFKGVESLKNHQK